MDSNRIKNLALGVRTSLMAEVSGRLDTVLAAGSPERLERPGDVSALEATLKERGRESLVESAAYTWFNRLCALRFMDSNGYTSAPVVTPRPDSTQPAILADAASGIFDPEYEISEETRRRVLGLFAGTIPSENAAEAAYSELLTAVCCHYAKPMPYLFADSVASPLLMPQGLLAEGSILARIVEGLDDEECESVEVLGWLYQFYISERKDEYFKSKRKATREDIAPATQLFTPDWIVRYLSENSLGRLWVLNNPDSDLASHMDYYIAPEEGVEEPHIQIDSAEEIRVLDPACGSGHILVYCFDLLFRMYEEEGWLPEDIPQMILENNLYGLEIDARAAEIASFALEMKARERDPRFFEKNIDAHVTVLTPVELSAEQLAIAPKVAERHALLDAMSHLDEVGSLYVPDAFDAMALGEAIASLADATNLAAFSTRDRCKEMLANVDALSGSYHCVVANPPYMGSGNMNSWLSQWVKENYPDEKGDLCTCFLNRGLGFAKKSGYVSMITASSWMFISSFEKMRKALLSKTTITSMIQQSTHGYPSVTVPTCMLTLGNEKFCSKGAYIRLEDFDRPKLQQPKAIEAIRNPSCGWFYRADAHDFEKIPGSPIAYWISNKLLAVFSNPSLSEFVDVKKGMSTGDNARFLRFWWEISIEQFSMIQKSNRNVIRKWVPYNKGGSYRKWYGNNDYVLNWGADGEELRNSGRAVLRNQQYYFRPSVTWSALSSGDISFRYKAPGSIHDGAGASMFGSEERLLYVQGALNSSSIGAVAKVLSPTMNFEIGQVSTYPIATQLPDTTDKVLGLVRDCRALSRSDWDSFETSWDFMFHPLCRADEPFVMNQFACWKEESRKRYDSLKSKEEELNLIFARVYRMEGEVPIEVPDDKVSVRLADLGRDVRSLVSYGIGCIFGRYSTEKKGFILADQGSTLADFKEKVPGASFQPDEDGVLPILDADWFGDDIVSSFKSWLSSTYGADALDENVRFIEGALRKDLRSYFLKDFYEDHWKTYQKRPIYWLFQSPKKGFSALIYMHRYTPSTVGTVLSGYLRPYGEKLRQRCAALDVPGATTAELKKVDKLRATISELEQWERDVVYPLAQRRIEIDLDDGVKVNYNKFPHALAKVPGLSEWK